jgi:hypothetical protein
MRRISPMKKTLAGLALVLAAVVPVAAHHSFAAEFDESKPIKVTGTITKVEWQNPHIWKEALKIGQEVIVEGFRAKDASNNGFGQKVTYPDGRNVFTANAPNQQ